jgi:hypothetical protein
MLSEICREIRNFFEVSEFSGTFTISGGNISHPTLLNGQYFRIIGSVFNDGVHKYPADGLTDETFAGEVWALAIPPELIALSSEIAEYEKSGGGVSAISSEHYPNGYSYTRTTDDNGDVMSWERAFSKRLNKWRKI